MEGTPTGFDSRATWLVWGAIAGVVVFNLGWFLAGALQAGGYSVASAVTTNDHRVGHSARD